MRQLIKLKKKQKKENSPWKIVFSNKEAHFFTGVQRKEKIKAFYQPHCIIPNNVMNLHFFGSSYIFKVKSICVKICISRKLFLNNARHERINIMKIKETCQLLLQPDSKRSLSKIAQNCSILLILNKYQKDVLIWS